MTAPARTDDVACCPRHIEPTLRPGSCYSAAFHFAEPCCETCPDFVRTGDVPDTERCADWQANRWLRDRGLTPNDDCPCCTTEETEL